MALTGCSDGHLKVSLGTNPYSTSMPQLRITAVEQGMVLRGVKINDGDCNLAPLEFFPRRLFVDRAETVNVAGECVVKKAEITTADGTYSFRF